MALVDRKGPTPADIVIAVALAVILWTTWPLRMLASRPVQPALSGLRVEYHINDGSGDKVTVELYVGETEDEWTERLMRAAQQLEQIR